MAQGACKVLVDGLTFPEGPRWHNGRLYFSDFYAHAVYAVTLDGVLEQIAEVPYQPSGLGWLPNGDLLMVSMKDQKVLRQSAGQLSVYADLSALARNHCNDMLVTSSGRAYVGNFGFDPHSEEPRNTVLIAVETDGRAHVAAADMAFPNGMATLNNETQLVVAESVGQLLSVFDIDKNGELTDRRVLARLPGCMPDGLCIDRNGDILAATMTYNKLVKISPRGDVLATTEFNTATWACASGGDDGETIFLCTSDHSGIGDCQRHRSGKIQILQN
jgi:sugar lactone lactonase YvrE